MSSQAERIKAFKLAQHTRIQKQDEEEQWISSEELCTEGSSDEETQVSVKTSQRKPKRNVRTEKRGISPLAQPPKVTESTSTYQSDSNYLLPDVYTNSNAVAKESGIQKPVKLDTILGENFDLLNYEAEYSGACSLSHDLVDLDEEKEMEKLIQWRPKRGSIKLPDMDEARSSALNHEIFENNAFFTEMSINMNVLKRSFNRRRPRNLEIDDGSEVNENNDDSKENSLWKNITDLDSEILDTNTKFESAKLERKVVERELCNSTTDLEVSQTHSKMFQDFVQLCNFQSSSEDRELAEANNGEDNCNIEEVKNKTKANQDNKFVKRNIELAKQHNSMGQVSLTDEEKLKLDDLLSDLDSEEYGGSNTQNENTISVNKNDKAKSIQELRVNYFKLKEEEESVMQDLNIKLNDILKSYENLQSGAQTETLPFTYNADKSIESAEKEGKLWKHHQIELRLQKIDKDLADISAKDLEEKKKLKEKLFDDKEQKQLLEGEEKI